MCVLMLCSLAGCGNNTGTANDNLNDATSGENYDGSGENGNNTGNNAGDQNGDSILDAAVDDVERPNNARAAPQGSRPLLIALLVMLFAACLIRSHRCRFLLLKIASQSVQRRNAR